MIPKPDKRRTDPTSRDYWPTVARNPRQQSPYTGCMQNPFSTIYLQSGGCRDIKQVILPGKNKPFYILNRRDQYHRCEQLLTSFEK